MFLNYGIWIALVGTGARFYLCASSVNRASGSFIDFCVKPESVEGR
jgi:hypothetical protein